jgi:isopentenyldiphosphate isomerase
MRAVAQWTVAGLQEQVDLCNDMGEGLELLPLVCDGATLGGIVKALAEELVGDGNGAFVFGDSDDGDNSHGGAVLLHPRLREASFEDRNAAVAATCDSLRERGVVTGWRDELVAVVPSYDADPAFLVERAAYPLLGCKGYGVHVNGYVEDGGGGGGEESLRLWIGTRAATKQTYPRLLDHIAAGQQPFGISPGENVVKECGEEAGVPEAIARGAKPASAISYRGVYGEGKGERVTNDVIMCYDIALPANFTPTPVDGEIEKFELMGVDDVLDRICAGAFKPNVALVTIDFLVRHGALTPELPGYLKLVGSLRQGSCS